MEVTIAHRFHGPPAMAHGGYVAGLLAEQLGPGPVQVTLRKPTPLDQPLRLERDGDAARLFAGDTLLVEAQRSTLELDVPPPPTLAEAEAAQAGSPSYFGERGVHPTCFGCAAGRAPGDGLRVLAGPLSVGGRSQVAAVWHPGAPFADARGMVHDRFALAALDCAGAFAFLAAGERAGLLGRIVVVQHAKVRADAPLRVTGWQIGRDGKKLLAGTALFDADGTLCAAARAIWFPF